MEDHINVRPCPLCQFNDDWTGHCPVCNDKGYWTYTDSEAEEFMKFVREENSRCMTTVNTATAL